MRVLFTMGNFGVQYVDRAAPNMSVHELATRPGGARDNINRGKAGTGVGRVIEQPNRIFDGERPKERLNDIRPANGGMQQQSAGHGHDCLNGAFSNTILVSSTNPGKACNLFEFKKVGCKGSGSKTRAIVRNIFRNNNSHVIENMLELGFRRKGLVRAGTNDAVNENVARSSVNKKTSTAEAFLVKGLAISCEEAARRATDEVIDKNALPRIDATILKRRIVSGNRRWRWGVGRAMMLFSELTGGTFRW